jgi:hypothetical protein
MKVNFAATTTNISTIHPLPKIVLTGKTDQIFPTCVPQITGDLPLILCSGQLQYERQRKKEVSVKSTNKPKSHFQLELQISNLISSHDWRQHKFLSKNAKTIFYVHLSHCATVSFSRKTPLHGTVTSTWIRTYFKKFKIRKKDRLESGV